METTAPLPYPVPPVSAGNVPQVSASPGAAPQPPPASPARTPTVPAWLVVSSLFIFFAVSYFTFRISVVAIPPVVHLSKREHMQLDNAVFTPATAFIRMSQAAPPVTSIVIDGRDYVKAIPETIGDIRSLTSITIMNQPIRALPDSIGNLTNLESLVIYNAPITALPNSIGNLTNLKTLVLANTKLVALPPSVANLTNLTTVNVSHNRLSRFPPSVTALPKLTSLELTANPITRLPVPIAGDASVLPPGYPPELKHLYLGNTLIPFSVLDNLTSPVVSTYY